MIEKTDQKKGSKRWIWYVIIAVIIVVAIVINVPVIIQFTLRESNFSSAREPDSIPRQFDDPYYRAEFELAFQSGFWSEGSHEYTIMVDYPGSDADFTNTNSFQVSSTSPLFPGSVLLRRYGLRAETLGSGYLKEIHPSQQTSALVVLKFNTSEEAETCNVSIRWDNMTPQPMILKSLLKFGEPDGW